MPLLQSYRSNAWCTVGVADVAVRSAFTALRYNSNFLSVSRVLSTAHTESQALEVYTTMRQLAVLLPQLLLL
eukprot:1904-Heterococcus_DN1.PRE.11